MDQRQKLDNHIKEKTRLRAKTKPLARQTNSGSSIAFGLTALFGAIFIAGLGIQGDEEKELDQQKVFDDLFAYGFYCDQLQIIPKTHEALSFYYDSQLKKILRPTLTDNSLLRIGDAETVAKVFLDTWSSLHYIYTYNKMSVKDIAKVYVKIRDSRAK